MMIVSCLTSSSENEAPPPRQDGTDDTTNGQDRRDERQCKQRCKQGRYTEEDDQITADERQPDQEEQQPDQEEHVQRTEHTGQPACQEEENTPTLPRRLSLLIGRWCLRTFTSRSAFRPDCGLGAPRLMALRTKPSGHSPSAERKISIHATTSTR